MEENIPVIVDELYRYFVTEPNPRLWPAQIQDPKQGHGLGSCSQGQRLGIQLGDAGLERL